MVLESVTVRISKFVRVSLNNISETWTVSVTLWGLKSNVMVAVFRAGAVCLLRFTNLSEIAAKKKVL